MSFEPIKVNADQPAIEDDRIPAFIITKNGQDTTYTIPRVISGATALRALEVYVTQGDGATTMFLAQHALGREGYEAVTDSPHLTMKQAARLLGQIGQQYIGQVKELGKAQADD